MNRIKNAPFVNVVAGNKATLSLPVGYTYHGILLQLGGTFTKAQCSRIVVRVNEKIIQDISGTNLDLVNTFKGGAVSATNLMIDFTEHQAKDIASELSGSIGTQTGVSRLTIEIDIAAGAVSPTLTSWSFVSGPTDLSPNIAMMIPQTVSYSGAGTWDLEIPHGPQSAHMYKRVWLFGSNIDSVVVKKNGLEVDDSNRAANEFMQTHYESTPNAAFYCVDFTIMGHTIGEIMTSRDAQDMRLKITTLGASTITYFLDSLGDLGAL